MLGQNAIANPKRKRGETKNPAIVLSHALAGNASRQGPEVFASRMKKVLSRFAEVGIFQRRIIKPHAAGSA